VELERKVPLKKRTAQGLSPKLSVRGERFRKRYEKRSQGHAWGTFWSCYSASLQAPLRKKKVREKNWKKTRQKF